MRHQELIHGGSYKVSLDVDALATVLQVRNTEGNQVEARLTIPEAIWLMEELSAYNAKLSAELTEVLR